MRLPGWMLLAVAVVAASRAAAAPPGPRPAWTTSRVVGTPDPPPPYRFEDAFPRLRFERPIEMGPVPESDRLFVAQLKGKVLTFANRRDAERGDLMIDLGAAVKELDMLYGMAFHPRYPATPYVYLCYAQPGGRQDGSHLSRFRVSGDPPVADPKSETVLLTFLSGGHNGCSIRFGLDGDLYVSTGDAAEPFPPDKLDVGQTVDDLLSAILRIDVDHPAPGKGYSIPSDNPFASSKGVRPEIWAYGFRNPWKMSFDPATGELWVGDVGWETWEMIHRVERGENHGWSVMEGFMRVRPEAKAGPQPFTPPIAVHPHSEARSITGGVVYRGQALADLRGTYVYGDFETGKIWGLRYDAAAKKVTWHQEIADARRNVVAFGVDRAGEVYIVDYGGATSSTSFVASGLYRLVRNPAAGANRAFPRQLSQTGLFRSAATHTLAPGVVEYAVNAAPWADGATGTRFVALPGRTSVTVERGRWKFPTGTVLGKTLALPGRRARRVETQLLHWDGELWRPYSYRWNDAGTDATLVEAAGEDVRVPVEGRTQSWRFHARGECSTCHNSWSGPVLAFSAPQLREMDGLVARQVLSAAPVEPYPRLHDPYDADAPIETRARSYLHVNCAHCHRFGAGGMAALQLPFELELGRTETVGTKPTQGTFGLSGAAVIVPGDPFRSVLFYRVATLGSGHMPRIGSRVLDMDGVGLIERWIRRLPAATSTPAPEARYADTLAEAQELRATAARSADPPAPIAARLLESTSGALMLLRALDQGQVPAAARDDLVTRAAAAERPEIRGLFERFLPEEQRAARLGEKIDPQQILGLDGRPERGRRLFQQGGAGCVACHRAGGAQGGVLGPDLAKIGTKYTREQILDNVLQPSKQVDAKYLWYVVETSDGQTLAGIMAERTTRAVALMDAQGTVTRVPMNKVKLLAAQDKSPMPELLLSALTAQEAADLIAFLASLK